MAVYSICSQRGERLCIRSEDVCVLEDLARLKSKLAANQAHLADQAVSLGGGMLVMA